MRLSRRKKRLPGQDSESWRKRRQRLNQLKKKPNKLLPTECSKMQSKNQVREKPQMRLWLRRMQPSMRHLKISRLFSMQRKQGETIKLGRVSKVAAPKK